MDSMYENSSFILTTVASGDKCSQYKGNSTLPKWTKVLLIVFAVCLVFALGGLCILGILYVNVSMQLSAQKTNNTIMTRRLEELTANYTRVREHLHINNISEPVMVRKTEEITTNYTRVREQLSFYEAFTAQSLNCDMSSTTFNGKLYFFSCNELNWSSSRVFCVSKGTDLVTITSQTEQSFLVSKIKAWHWIGLNDLKTEGHWVWVNNQTLNESGVHKHSTNHQGREMYSNYENVDYLPSATASGGKCSQYRGNSTEELESEREVCPPKWTKVLLIVFAVCLVFALGGLCILGILYVRVSVQLSAKKTNGTNYKEEFDVLRNQHKKTLEKLSRLNHSTGCALCAVHWVHSGRKCYYYSAVKMNWTQSRDHCVTLGGHLVIINSKAEQDFVTSNVEETHWIGLNDVDTEGHWVWVNNQPLNNSIEFWMKRENEISEPDNWTKVHPDGEDCASLGHPGGETDFWMDAYCFEEKRFVCEAAAAV